LRTESTGPYSFNVREKCGLLACLANINGAVPSGYEKATDVPKRSPDYGRLRLTPDTEVRDRIALVLRKGLELGGVLAVVRYLRGQSLRVPTLRLEADKDGAPRR
jgi:hypothetical protein